MSAAQGATHQPLPPADLVARTARRLAKRLPPHIDMRDLMQAAWVRMLRLPPAAAAVRDPAHQVAHLTLHTRGAMLDELRATDPVLRRAMASADDDTHAELDAVACPAAQPDIAVERAQSLRVLHAAVCELPHPLRMVVLHQLAEVPAHATAATLHISPSRVSQLRADALRLLRLRLARRFAAG